LWFPGNFSQGYLRKKLSQPQEPALGEYSSVSPAVSEQQIKWGEQAGIDFFTLDYWPKRTGFREAINSFLNAPNISSTQFAIFYEFWNLGFDPAIFSTKLEESDYEIIRADFQYFTENYFTHPSYLLIDGKPVVFLYLTRTLIGDIQRPFQTMREIARNAGIELYLIGDEIYWINSQQNDEGEIQIVENPSVARASALDAIFMYNPYAPSLTQQSGYGSTSSFLSDLDSLYQRYRQVLPDTPIVPMVMPGYNDRGVRLDQDNFVIPRQWSEGESETSFFQNMLERSTLPNLDSRLPMYLITSWNEWNEDTAIEPNASLPGSNPDDTAFTQGYKYSVYGEQYLELLSDSVQ
jgi:hypothetical protein